MNLYEAILLWIGFYFTSKGTIHALARNSAAMQFSYLAAILMVVLYLMGKMAGKMKKMRQEGELNGGKAKAYGFLTQENGQFMLVPPFALAPQNAEGKGASELANSNPPITNPEKRKLLRLPRFSLIHLTKKRWGLG